MKTQTLLVTAALALAGLSLTVPGVAAHNCTAISPDYCGGCQAPHTGTHYIGDPSNPGSGVPYCTSTPGFDRVMEIVCALGLIDCSDS